MPVVKRGRGRPTKAEAAAKLALAQAKAVKRPDAQVLADIVERFGFLSKLTIGAVNRTIRSAVVTGGPGVGKTYTVERILKAAKEQKNTPFEIVRGAISAVEMYKLGYRMRAPGSVVVLDDADSVFGDEEALNILKVLCDSNKSRTASWLKDSNTLKAEDVPTSYDFDGCMMFISNLKFDEIIETGKHKFVPHLEALRDRSLHLDLRLHTRDEIGVWVNHVATKGKMLETEGLTPTQGKEALEFLTANRERLQSLSLRTVQKLAQMIRSGPDWKAMANVLLLKHSY